MGYSSKSQISACTSLEPFLSKYAQTTEGPFWVSRSSSLIPIATRYASRRLSILWLGTIRKRTPPTSCLFKVILATTEEPNHYLLATNQKTISTPSASHSETHRKYWNTLVKPNHYTSPIYQQYSTTNHLFERVGNMRYMQLGRASTENWKMAITIAMKCNLGFILNLLLLVKVRPFSSVLHQRKQHRWST